ncbi:hypothetical protein KVM00_05300 [Helicobacter pylori]|nr:hypothetical protein KVM00_05300 [Helicobacter pylori]
MIDQLQVVPKVQVLENNTMGRSLALALQKVQVLENNTMGRSLALALQKASIPRPASAHRAPLINHFLE